MIDSGTINTIVEVTGAAIPVVIGFLVSHKVVSKRRLNQVYSYAVFAASAAEELYSSETIGGEIKQRYTVDRVCKRFGITTDEAELFVNAAVTALRQSGVKAPKSGNPSRGVHPIVMSVGSVPPSDAA